MGSCTCSSFFIKKVLCIHIMYLKQLLVNQQQRKLGDGRKLHSSNLNIGRERTFKINSFKLTTNESSEKILPIVELNEPINRSFLCTAQSSLEEFKKKIAKCRQFQVFSKEKLKKEFELKKKTFDLELKKLEEKDNHIEELDKTSALKLESLESIMNQIKGMKEAGVFCDYIKEQGVIVERRIFNVK